MNKIHRRRGLPIKPVSLDRIECLPGVQMSYFLYLQNISTEYPTVH